MKYFSQVNIPCNGYLRSPRLRESRYLEPAEAEEEKINIHDEWVCFETHEVHCMHLVRSLHMAMEEKSRIARR